MKAFSEYDLKVVEAASAFSGSCGQPEAEINWPRSRKPFSKQSPLRVLTYSHDSFGLGHLRRSVTLASAILQESPNAQALCLTGSPVPDLFELPDRCEVIKIPGIGKGDKGQYVSRRLPVSFGEISTLRSELITATVRAFRPNVLLVDHTATGPGDELLPVLRRICHENFNTRVILGLRDVLDSPEKSRIELQSRGVFDTIRRCYDDVFVYGYREVFDTVAEYAFPGDIARKVQFVGPIVPEASRRRNPRRHCATQPHILVTAGGGEDGFRLLRGTIAAARAPLSAKALRLTVVAGPMMPAKQHAALCRAAEGDARISVLRSSREMQSLMGSADLVVGMGGYNTVYETLACGVPMLVLPRRFPRSEQWERCSRLADTGHLSLLEESEVGDAHALAQRMQQALYEPARPKFQLCFNGASRAARICLSGVGDNANAKRQAALG